MMNNEQTATGVS